jgi:hypothetical protein
MSKTQPRIYRHFQRPEASVLGFLSFIYFLGAIPCLLFLIYAAHNPEPRGYKWGFFALPELDAIGPFCAVLFAGQYVGLIVCGPIKRLRALLPWFYLLGAMSVSIFLLVMLYLVFCQWIIAFLWDNSIALIVGYFALITFGSWYAVWASWKSPAKIARDPSTSSG